MNRNAEEIRREIERTRGELAQNLEAISDRMSPKHVKEQVSEKVGEITDKVNPRHLLKRQVQKVKEGLSNTGGSISPRAGAAPGAGGRVSQQARSLGRRGQSVTADVVDQVRSAPHTNPMATALVAFGAGLVVGLALPPSEKERQAAGTLAARVVEPVKDHAVQAGKTVAEDLQPAARSKVEGVKATATRAVERIKDETKGASGDVKRQAATAGDRVKGRARQAAKSTTSQARSATTTKSAAKRSAGQVRDRASV